MKHNLNLIGLIGRAGSGKDTVYSMINKRCGGVYENVKFATALKVIAGYMLNFSPDLFEDRDFKNMALPDYWNFITVREFLQKLGTDAIRNGLHEDAWVNILFQHYDEKDSDYKWVITDCRMRNEAARIKQYGGILVRIIRPNYVVMNNHVTETEMDSITPDYIIYNDGSFHDLQLSVDKMITHFENENRITDKAGA